MRPNLVCECNGVPLFWIEDQRTHDSDSITVVLSFLGRDCHSLWPRGNDGQPLNPWRVTLQEVLFATAYADPKSPAGRPETWHDRPSLL